MAKGRLEQILRGQFWGFLNLALRNPWIITKKEVPASWHTRLSQINSSISVLGLKNDMACSEGDLKCFSCRAEELYKLIETLADKLGQKTLKKLAETKYANLKLQILLNFISIHDYYYFHNSWATFRSFSDFEFLSYRRRISRALKTLIELKLVYRDTDRSSGAKGYYLTGLGEDICKELEMSFYKWIYKQLPSLRYYLEAVSREDLHAQ